MPAGGPIATEGTGVSHLVAVHRVMLASILGITLVLTMLIAPARAQTAPDDCAEAMPVDEITVGMAGHGLTVERGTATTPFDAEILGVLEELSEHHPELEDEIQG